MYICQQLDSAGNCIDWIEYTPILEALAISKEQAGLLALAICTLMLVGFVAGLMGKMMLESIK